MFDLKNSVAFAIHKHSDLKMQVLESLGIIDNARTHITDNVLQRLDDTFNGLWAVASPYSPHLKPVEKLFKLVKAYLHQHEDEALGDPIFWINKAFHRYSAGGPRGHVCRGFWKPYERLHSQFQAGLI